MKPNLAHISGLAKVDVDVGDLVVFEKSKDVLSRALGSRRGGGVGGDTNPDSDGTDNRLWLALFVVLALDDLLKTNDVDRCKTSLKFYKDCDDDNNRDGGSDGDNIDSNEHGKRP